MSKLSKRRLVLVNIVLVAAFCGLAFWYSRIPVPVKIAYESVADSETVTYETRSKTVSAVFEELKADGEKNIILDTDGDQSVRTDMTIKVKRGETSTANVAGKTKKVVLYPGTVKENLKANKIEYDENDIVRPKLTSKVKSSTKLVVKDVEVKTTEKTVAVSAEEELIFDKTLSSGTVSTTEGKDGEGVYQYKTTYVNGKKTKVKTKFLRWKTKPVNHTTRLGTSRTGETGSVSYSRTFTGNITAYYAGKNATGATGQRCYYGTCAVDPSVIPYGTKLYIEGYGVAVANDCGGAVKGNIVDVYMDSTSACISWGRRYKKVYVLK